jgi:hypothetical protein
MKIVDLYLDVPETADYVLSSINGYMRQNEKASGYKYSFGVRLLRKYGFESWDQMERLLQTESRDGFDKIIQVAVNKLTMNLDQARRLEHEHPGSAASLREGLEESASGGVSTTRPSRRTAGVAGSVGLIQCSRPSQRSISPPNRRCIRTRWLSLLEIPFEPEFDRCKNCLESMRSGEPVAPQNLPTRLQLEIES